MTSIKILTSEMISADNLRPGEIFIKAEERIAYLVSTWDGETDWQCWPYNGFTEAGEALRSAAQEREESEDTLKFKENRHVTRTHANTSPNEVTRDLRRPNALASQ